MNKDLWKVEKIDIDGEQITAIVNSNGAEICYMQVGMEHKAKDIVKKHNGESNG
jgi:hypothetical protein